MSHSIPGPADWRLVLERLTGRTGFFKAPPNRTIIKKVQHPSQRPPKPVTAWLIPWVWRKPLLSQTLSSRWLISQSEPIHPRHSSWFRGRTNCRLAFQRPFGSFQNSSFSPICSLRGIALARSKGPPRCLQQYVQNSTEPLRTRAAAA